MECTRLVAAVVAAVTVLGAVAIGGTVRTDATPGPAQDRAPATILASGSFLPDLPDFRTSNRAW
jgi:hypothetical protein